MSNCNCHAEIIRDGSGRLGRYLRALDPSYAPIDDRSFEELLVFAKRMAAQVRFYSLPEEYDTAVHNGEQLDWKGFFQRDLAVIAASIGVTDLKEIQEEYEDTRKDLDANPDKDRFRALFDPIIGMMRRVDSWYSNAIVENPLHSDLKLGIASVLLPAVQKMRAFDKGFYMVDPSQPLSIDLSEIKDRDAWELDENIPADATIYNGSSAADKMRSAALYVDDIFYTFFNYFSALVNDSAKYMTYAMEQYPSHQPHMALFIAFVKLFRLLQEQANGITEKMLTFYYRDVLRLDEKPSIPDKAFVVFELAKDVATHHLAKDTALNAGKDSSGKDKTYTTASDLVINQAKVVELKTIFIDKVPAQDSDSTITNIYARPVANSADGFGEKFADTLAAWPTFGEGALSMADIKNPCDLLDAFELQEERKDISQVGFAIASPQLLMQGGKRFLQVTSEGFGIVFSPLHTDPEEDFTIYLTGETSWLKIDRRCTEAEVTALVETAATSGIFPGEYIESGYFLDSTSTLNIYIAPEEEPVLEFDPEIHTGVNLQTNLPVLRVMINPSQRSEKEYNRLRMDDLSIRVKVGSIVPTRVPDTGYTSLLFEGGVTERSFDGLRDVIIVNQNGIVPSDKPFDPFGSPFRPGSSFYVGSNEIFNKPLGELAVFFRTTEGSSTYDTNHNNFTVNVLDKREWHLLRPAYSSTFSRQTLQSNILTQPKDQREVIPYSLQRIPPVDIRDGNLQAVRGFVSIKNRLTDSANVSYTAEVLQRLAQQMQISEISLSYDSKLDALDLKIDQVFHIYPFGVVETYPTPSRYKESLNIWGREPLEGKKRDLPSNPQEVFQELDKDKDGLLVRTNHLLPQFTYTWPYKFQDRVSTRSANSLNRRRFENFSSADMEMFEILAETKGIRDKYKGGFNQYSGEVGEEGMLFIGVEKLQPLQTLSLLFQFADGSAFDEDNDPPKIHWSYLTNNEMRPMKDDRIIYDSTFGFQTTGIVKIDVPGDITSHNTLLSEGLYWFMASVTEHAERIPRLIDVVAQAVESVYQDNDTDAAHHDAALPAGSISKLSVAEAAVSKVSQPFASFDGKPKELGKEYYTRVSERLRHKGRAINAWDYEHLVLERFPSIYKIKCITHTDPNCFCRSPHYIGDGIDNKTCCGPQVAPGHVLLVPIPSLKNRNAVNPLQPKTGRRTLLDIEAFISKRTSPFVKVHARNPEYEEVLVSFRVKFHSGVDKGFFLKKLNDEIVHFLTPWAFDENAEVKFGAKIYASSIINFIEERDYVDFITDFQMFVCRDTCCTQSNPDKQPEQVEAPAVVIGDVHIRETEKNEVKATGEHKRSKDDEVARTLSDICGCSGLEKLMRSNKDFIGETVATPATSRSILVSVEQHNILLYEEPEALSPCEQRLLAKKQSPVVVDNTSNLRKKEEEIQKIEKVVEKRKPAAPKKKAPAKRPK